LTTEIDALDLSALRRACDRAAPGYERHAVPYRQICERLLARLDYIRCDPQTALDVGAGTGQAALALLARYRTAKVIAADISHGMLRTITRPKRWRRKLECVQCNAQALPIRDASVDLLVSASTFQWCRDYPQLFAEIKRVLSPHGVLLFATFGPDTLQELRHAWMQVDDAEHVHEFTDMHVLGDAMLNAGLVDPVVDSERLRLSYAHPQGVLHDLRAAGSVNAGQRRPRGLRGSDTLQRLLHAYPRTPDGACVATYEVIYGHAWGSRVGERAVNVAFDTGL
jgi:malonyl-CoA O-methyltransferase